MILTEIMLNFLYFSSDDNVVKFQDNKEKMNLITFKKYITESDIQIFLRQGIVKFAILNINILTL